MVERDPVKIEVGGSSPSGGANSPVETSRYDDFRTLVELGHE